jgi:DHA1 family quinolone resistance protein-like MFS transporter
MVQKPSSIKDMLTRELVAILLVSAAAFSTQELLNPVLPLYMREVGLSDQNIGLAFSLMMVGIAFSEVFWGWAVDRIDLKYVLILGSLAYGVMTLTLMIPKSASAFLIVIVFYGASRSPLYIVGRWYMGVHAPEDIKAKAFAFMSMVNSVPTILAGFSSGFLVEAWGFHTAIRISAGVPLVVGFLTIIASRWLHYARPEKDQTASQIEANGPPVVDGHARRVTFFLGSFGVFMFIALGVSMSYLPLFAADVVHLSPSRIGILAGLRGIIQTLVILPLGMLADRIGKRVFVPASMAVVALSMVAVVVSRNFGMLLFSTGLFAIGAGMYFPTVSAILSENVPVIWIGTAMGIYGLLEDVGWMIGPAVGGLLLNTWDLQAPFLFGAIVTLLGVPLYYLGRRVLPPRKLVQG